RRNGKTQNQINAKKCGAYPASASRFVGLPLCFKRLFDAPSITFFSLATFYPENCSFRKLKLIVPRFANKWARGDICWKVFLYLFVNLPVRLRFSKFRPSKTYIR